MSIKRRHTYSVVIAVPVGRFFVNTSHISIWSGFKIIAVLRYHPRPIIKIGVILHLGQILSIAPYHDSSGTAERDVEPVSMDVDPQANMPNTDSNNCCCPDLELVHVDSHQRLSVILITKRHSMHLTACTSDHRSSQMHPASFATSTPFTTRGTYVIENPQSPSRQTTHQPLYRYHTCSPRL